MIKYYQQQEDRYSTTIFKEVNKEINKEQRNATAKRKINGKVIFYNIIELAVEPTTVYDHPLFNNKITKAIERGIVVATSDASFFFIQMARYQYITDYQKEETLSNKLYHKKQVENTIVGAEAIILLELIEVLK